MIEAFCDQLFESWKIQRNPMLNQMYRVVHLRHRSMQIECELAHSMIRKKSSDIPCHVDTNRASWEMKMNRLNLLMN